TDRKLMIVDHHLGLREVADFSHLAPGPANDMVVDARGRAYIGNFGFDYSAGAEFEATVLVRVDPTGDCTGVAAALAFPTGTLILAETFAQRLTAFDILPDAGLANRRTWAQLERGHPDGICQDADGNIWVASPTTRECILLAEGGAVLRRIEMEHGRGAYACV